jgi:hypothetical protein
MRVEISVIAGDLDLEKDIEEIERQFAEQIPIEARRIVDESAPAGKVYRRGGIRARRTAAGIKAGLRAYRKTRMTVGNQIHRASAPGQPWAKDSGRAYREIKVMRTGRGKFRVVFGAPYIGYLEFNLNRPVVVPAVEAAANRIFNDAS